MGLTIGEFNLDDRVLVIAEIGNNHEGDADLAHEMVRAALGAGADAVKFQTFRTEQFIDREQEARFRQLSSYELSFETFESLAALTHELGGLFMSSPFDAASAAFLEQHVDAFKIASGDNDHYPLIRQVASTSKPLIVSTGLSDIGRVARVVEEVEAIRVNDARLALLHCVSAYPTPPEEATLGAIAGLSAQFGHVVGFSDHTVGITASPVAVAAGARIIEKHFTLAGIESDFRDHELSADEGEMERLVAGIREVEVLLGGPEIAVQPSEVATGAAVSRSAISARELAAGDVLKGSDLFWVRPGGGFAPERESELVGRRLSRPLAAGRRLTPEDLA